MKTGLLGNQFVVQLDIESRRCPNGSLTEFAYLHARNLVYSVLTSQHLPEVALIRSKRRM